MIFLLYNLYNLYCIMESQGAKQALLDTGGL